MKQPLVSIVVPTYKRKDSLLRLFHSMRILRKNEFEVIVVEQGISNKRDIMGEAKKLKISLRYIFLPTRSTSHAKNVGATSAQGRYILFLDDDVVIQTADFLQAHRKNFSDSRVGAVCGRSIAEGQAVEKDRTNVGKISVLGQFSDGYSSEVKQEIDTVIGCNASWRADVFRKLGSFDEQFTGNAMREESDLSLRAKALGYTILFEPLALVHHMRDPVGGARKTEGRMRWYFDFFSNETYFFLKHRPAVLLPLFWLTRWEWAARCMFGIGREVSARSLVTPITGAVDGIKKYWRHIYENRR